MKRKLYKMDFSCGRQGSISGVFVEEPRIVNYLIENKIPIYFGEVLGKHSEIYGYVDKSEIKGTAINQDVIDIIKEYDLESGHNPLTYHVLGDYFDTNEPDFGDVEYYDWNVRDYIIYKLDNIKPEKL